MSFFINSQRCGSVYFLASWTDEIFWLGCGKRCFPVRGRSWFHWWRNCAVLLWGHGRRSSQVLPPRERPGIAPVRCTYVYIWAGRSPSHARRLCFVILRGIDNILPVSFDVQSVVLRSVLQVTTTSLVCQCDVSVTFTKKKCSLWAKIFSIIMLEGESIFITSEGVGAEKYLEGCWRARGKRKVDFVNKKFCKQLTIRYLYLYASISTLNSQTHRPLNATVTQLENLPILELILRLIPKNATAKSENNATVVI